VARYVGLYQRPEGKTEGQREKVEGEGTSEEGR